MFKVNPSSQFDSRERLESIKAGTLAALSVTLAYGLVTVGNGLVLAERFQALASLQITSGINLMISGAFAFLSGFLLHRNYTLLDNAGQCNLFPASMRGVGSDLSTGV